MVSGLCSLVLPPWHLVSPTGVVHHLCDETVPLCHPSHRRRSLRRCAVFHFHPRQQVNEAANVFRSALWLLVVVVSSLLVPPPPSLRFLLLLLSSMLSSFFLFKLVIFGGLACAPQGVSLCCCT